MEKECEIYTVADYLSGKVKFGVNDETLRPILLDRGLDLDIPYGDADKSTLRLAYADTLKWFVLGASKVNNTSDSDNGWSHSGGGYELSDTDRRELKEEANAIYQELEPSSVFKSQSSFKIVSHGIKRATYTPYGMPLGHVIKH
jgi:hypothetical protein